MAKSSKKSRSQAKKSQESHPEKRIASKPRGSGGQRLAPRRVQPRSNKTKGFIVPSIAETRLGGVSFVGRHPESALIPIAPESGLYLHPRNHGNDQRFAEVFAQTWKKVPGADRETIVKHWQECDYRSRSQLVHPEQELAFDFADPSEIRWVVPKVELLSGWVGACEEHIVPDKKHPRGSKWRWAEVFPKGQVMRFHAPFVDQLPDKILGDLIAHEIAHVYQFAVGPERLFGPGVLEPTRGQYEEDADRIMLDWGFDLESVDRWADEQGLVKYRTCKTKREYYERLYGKGSRYGAK